MSLINPKLLNPTTIVIEQKDDAQTVFDHRRRAANVIARKPQVTLKAQIKWLTTAAKGDPETGQIGIDEQQTGYAVVLAKDFRALASPIVRGDRVVKIEDVDVSLFVTRIEYASHYAGQFRLVKIVFEDRESQD